jgi:hypothetical protein
MERGAEAGTDMQARKAFRSKPAGPKTRSVPPKQSEMRLKAAHPSRELEDLAASVEASVDAALAQLESLEMTPSQHAELAPPSVPQRMPRGMPPLPFTSPLPRNMPPLPTAAATPKKR